MHCSAGGVCTATTATTSNERLGSFVLRLSAHERVLVRPRLRRRLNVDPSFWRPDVILTPMTKEKKVAPLAQILINDKFNFFLPDRGISSSLHSASHKKIDLIMSILLRSSYFARKHTNY